MYKKYYQHFLNANKGVQHYAAHSHHYWPDVTREAMLEYWDDSAKLVDDKWDYFFSHKIPLVQKHICEVLNLTQPKQIVFAPNTHELVGRLLSCFQANKKINILTTDSEFYSFDRQINRLAEDQQFVVTKVTTEDFANFTDRFVAEIKKTHFDFIFLSQVFFNSGLVVDNLEKIVKSVTDPQTLIVIDGYHAFMALPTDLKNLEDRVFYIAGSYKYAQGGEGCCFMHVPVNCKLRPQNTGWFAGFSELSNKSSQVLYTNDGYRFAGSTMDFSALYRLLAVLDLFKKDQLTVNKIHQNIQTKQNNFLNYLQNNNFKYLKESNILKLNYQQHGHFFSFDLQKPEIAKQIYDQLKQFKIITDYRGSRLRFGFGLYQEECVDLSDVKSL